MAENMMSPADMSAVLGHNDFNGGGAWWIIILFLFMMGNGWNRGDYGQFASAASQQEILFGQQFNRLEQKADSITNGIADATYALNNTIVAEGRGIQTQLGNMAAEQAKQTCAITSAIHAEGEQTRALIQQNELQALRDKVAALEADNRMCGVVRYPLQTVYNSGANPFCNCNCGNGNI